MIVFFVLFWIVVAAFIFLVGRLTVHFWKYSPRLGVSVLLFTALVGLYFRVDSPRRWLLGFMIWGGGLVAIRMLTVKSHDLWRYLVVTLYVAGVLVGLAGPRKYRQYREAHEFQAGVNDLAKQLDQVGAPLFIADIPPYSAVGHYHPGSSTRGSFDMPEPAGGYTVVYEAGVFGTYDFQVTPQPDWFDPPKKCAFVGERLELSPGKCRPSGAGWVATADGTADGPMQVASHGVLIWPSKEVTAERLRVFLTNMRPTTGSKVLKKLCGGIVGRNNLGELRCVAKNRYN
jgi:hypothetical protein